jgi:hypothetical protein
MSCFQALVGNKFMADAPFEILKAKRLLVNEHPIFGDEFRHTFDKNLNQQAYYHVGNSLGFFNELYNIDTNSKRLYYLQYDRFLMIACRSKRLIDTAIKAATNVNGDVPIYRTKHVIRKVGIHTVLFNTNFTIPPVSPN